VRNCHYETTNKPQDEPCKFCGKVLTSWKKLTVHLAKHMEHISLPVLDLVNKQPINADTIISPVEPLPARQNYPVTPTGQDIRRLSNTSAHYTSLSAASMSPAPNMIGHYQNMQPVATDFYGEISYEQNVANRGMDQPLDHTMKFPMPFQDNPGMGYDAGVNGYTRFDQLGPNTNLNPQSHGYNSMNHSPHIDQSGFNQPYTTPVYQQSHHSYPNSNHTLSPDPSSFVSGAQQMPGFQGPTLGSDPSFTTGTRQMNVNAYASNNNHLIGMNNDQYNYASGMVNNNNNQFNQMRMDLEPEDQGQYPIQQSQIRQGAATYPPVSQSDYGYGHGQ
jgi:hypothetical protein